MQTILFSDNSLWGCLNFRGYIITHFVNTGFRVVIVAPEDKNLTAAQIPNGVIFEPICLGRTGSNPIADFKYMQQLKAIYRKYNPMVVFHYTIKPNIYGTFAADSLGIPSVTMVTGLGYVFDNLGITASIGRFLYKKGLSKAHKILFLNKDNYLTLLEKRFVTTDNSILLKGGEGVDVSRFCVGEPPKNKKTVFLMIARVLYDKGYNEFVAAARAIKQAEFRLIGAIDTNPNAVPKDVVQKESSIRYFGFMNRDQVMEQIKCADCIVLPSYHEGMSITLIEAIAMGKPVIASDIAGCREAVEHDSNGFLCERRNAESFTQACQNFIALSPDQRASMGQNSRRLACEVFDIKDVVGVYNQIISDILRKDNGSTC